METRSVGFLIEPQNQGRWFFGLDLKTDNSGFVIWDSNHRDGFLIQTSKPRKLQFVGCATKPTGE
jgi:hypothetical protein